MRLWCFVACSISSKHGLDRAESGLITNKNVSAASIPAQISAHHWRLVDVFPIYPSFPILCSQCAMQAAHEIPIFPRIRDEYVCHISLRSGLRAFLVGQFYALLDGCEFKHGSHTKLHEIFAVAPLKQLDRQIPRAV